jgi:hypothetical protein
MEEVRLIEKNGQHWYFVPEAQEEFPSVTTILQKLKKPHVQEWAVNRALEYVGDELIPNKGLPIDPEYIRTILKEAKGKPKEHLDDAGKIGTIIHGYAETYFKYQIEHGVAMDNPLDLLKDEKDFRAHSGFRAFLDCIKEINWKPIHSEIKTYSLIHKYAGTIDAIGTTDIGYAIGDIKSSNQIGNDYYMQLAAYAMAEYERTGKEFKDFWIWRFGKEDGTFELRHLTQEDIEQSYRGFLGVAGAFHADEYIKLRNKKQVKTFSFK